MPHVKSSADSDKSSSVIRRKGDSMWESMWRDWLSASCQFPLMQHHLYHLPPPTHTRVQRWRVMPTNNWNICAWLQKCRFSKPGCKQWQRGKPASPRCVRLCRRGKSRDPDYAISYVPAGGGRRTQRACFLILCETAYIFPSSSSHLPFCRRIQRHFITYHAVLWKKFIFDSVLLHCWILF